LLGRGSPVAGVAAFFTTDGRYQDACFDEVLTGRWTLRGTTITLFHAVPDERKRSSKDQEKLRILRIERQPDRTVVQVGLEDGSIQTWIKRPNQAMQPTAGRRTIWFHFMKARSLQATLAFASGG